MNQFIDIHVLHKQDRDEQKFAEALDPPELYTTVIETAEAIVQFHAARRK